MMDVTITTTAYVVFRSSHAILYSAKIGTPSLESLRVK